MRRPSSRPGRRDDYVVQVLRLLWPGDSPAEQQTLVVLPVRSRPRLVVQMRPARAAASAVGKFKNGTGVKGLLFRLVAGLARLGGLTLLPSRVRVAKVGGIDDYLTKELGRPVHVSVYAGPPRAVRKPVLRLTAEDGSLIGFAKVGVDDFTTDLVNAEAAAVAKLSRADAPHLVVPELLHVGDWDGHRVVVQSGLAPTTSPLDPLLLAAAMHEVAHAASAQPTRAPLSTSSYWVALQNRVEALSDSPWHPSLRDGISAIEGAAGDVDVEFGAWHGDWAPWNMLWSNGQAFVWDWEKFRDDVPVGLDAVHHVIQGRVVIDAQHPITAFHDAPQAPLLTAASGQHGQLLVWIYAVEIAVTYLEDRESEHGDTRMGRLDTWLEQVLATVARLPTRG